MVLAAGAYKQASTSASIEKYSQHITHRKSKDFEISNIANPNSNIDSTLKIKHEESPIINKKSQF